MTAPSRDADKNEKGLRSLTVVSIVKEGWGYAPWKKPKSNKEKSVRPPDAKPLFEVLDLADDRGLKAIRSVRGFTFDREGKFDKGARVEDKSFELAVGMTVRFKIQGFMYESRAGDKNVFPTGLEYLPEFSMVEAMFVAGTTESAAKGFALSLATIRPLPHTLHSYLHPLGLALVPSTFDASKDLAAGLVERGAPIQAMIEPSFVSFFAAASPSAYLTSFAPGMYRLTSASPPAVESVHQVDVREEDLLAYTNAGGDIGYAIFLVDLAAAAGALSLFVVRDPYYQVRVDSRRAPGALCDSRRAPRAEKGPDLQRVPRRPHRGHRQAALLRRRARPL